MLALWHITFVEKGLQAVLRPKTPDYSAPGENVEINRISLAPTINECISVKNRHYMLLNGRHLTRLLLMKHIIVLPIVIKK